MNTFYSLLLCLVAANFSYAQIQANCNGTSNPKVLLAGDSWAQFMGDDNSYNDIFHRYGHPDKTLVTETLGSSPPPPYTGTAYAISGSEAREWANTNLYPYIQNMVDALNANPEVQTVVLSIGGNDVLAAKSGGGWYKDMDLDVPGSEQALFNTIEADMLTIIDAAKAVRPEIEVLLGSYEYPNFDVGFLTCWIYACPKREDLSRDPDNDLITNAELNEMMIIVEEQRTAMVDAEDRVFFDNSVGLMHHYYGDGVVAPGTLPHPVAGPPYTPGGNPALPALRENFRITGDPIHLNYDGYQYKIKNQVDNYFFEKFRANPDATFFSEGGNNDGWVDVIAGNLGTNGIKMGDDGVFPDAWNDWRGILSFDTESLPDHAIVTGASIYLHRSGAGGNTNPYALEDRSPKMDIIAGTFGNPEIELTDGLAQADAEDVGCFHGTVPNNYYATRIDINPTYLEHINTSGRTQFRLYFDLADWNANYINYFDGSQNGLTSDGVLKSGKTPKELIYTEQMIEVPQKDGTMKEESRMLASLPHNGLADMMGTAAPFLDVSFSLPLPIALSDFSAFAKNHTAVLEWQTAHEILGEGFHIERSKDSENWEKIGFKTATLQQFARKYHFIDKHPLSGENYYRLAAEGKDGKMEYSEIKTLFFGIVADWVTVYPNPFAEVLNIELETIIEGNVELTLVDVLGNRIFVKHLEADGLSTFSLPMNEQLPKGNYFLNVKWKGGNINVALVK